jgi:hypothetical protein
VDLSIPERIPNGAYATRKVPFYLGIHYLLVTE